MTLKEYITKWGIRGLGLMVNQFDPTLETRKMITEALQDLESALRNEVSKGILE